MKSNPAAPLSMSVRDLLFASFRFRRAVRRSTTGCHPEPQRYPYCRVCASLNSLHAPDGAGYTNGKSATPVLPLVRASFHQQGTTDQGYRTLAHDGNTI